MILELCLLNQNRPSGKALLLDSSPLIVETDVAPDVQVWDLKK
jgi:hypothetical protein